jgi:hypothetical protein
MAVQVFSDVYLGQCDHCGADLEDWAWIEDDMVFHTTCTCGTEYKIEPTAGILTAEEGDLLSDDEEEETEDD